MSLTGLPKKIAALSLALPLAAGQALAEQPTTTPLPAGTPVQGRVMGAPPSRTGGELLADAGDVIAQAPAEKPYESSPAVIKQAATYLRGQLLEVRRLRQEVKRDRETHGKSSLQQTLKAISDVD